jgi:chromosome partitioning protein
MIPQVITLATSKGGAGKSTLVRSLAGHWLNIGLLPAIVDSDPQGSIISRYDPNGPFSKLVIIADPEESVSTTINELRAKHKPILVDTGGFRNKTTIIALINSDLVIIPLKPSADDMAVAIETYQLIKELNETPERINNPIKIRMIITMSQQGTIISRHVRSELEEVGLPIMKAEMYLRVAYPETGIKGLAPSITDPESAAAQDIAKIAAEITEY